ncbi:hypothetical protein ACQ4PT_066599 [Festuca glaucescens]
MVDSSFTEFKLDYPEIKGHLLGNAVSRRISAGRYSWKVECCYMDGVEGDILDVQLSVYSKFKTFHGFVDVFLLRRDDAPSSCRAKRSLLETDEYNKGSYLTWWGHLYVKRGCLESRYVKNGVITLICGVIALPANSITVPALNISDHFGSLLGCSDGLDVSFSVGGKMFRAHRAVLAARSPVFKSELFGTMLEATTPCITLDDIDPATFKAMLRFMYTDRLSVELDPETLSPTAQQFHLVLAAADSFTEFKLDYPEIKGHLLGNAVSRRISAGRYSWKVECCYMDGVEGDILDVQLSVYSKFKTFHGFVDVFLLRRDDAPSSCRAKR